MWLPNDAKTVSVPATVLMDKRLKPNDMRVLLLLAYLANEQGAVQPRTTNELSFMARIDVRHVQRSLKNLKSYGWLSREVPPKGSTKGRARMASMELMTPRIQQEL